MLLRSLRAKLAIGNALPILLLAPLLGLFLLYTLEQFFAKKILQQLSQQAALIAARVQETPDLLTQAESVQAFLFEIEQFSDAHITVLSQKGEVLGSSRPEHQIRLATQASLTAIESALRGMPMYGTSSGIVGDVAYVALPVGHQGVMRGVLLLSYEFEDVRAEFRYLRLLVLSGVGVTALIALTLGLALATTITRPISQLTQSVRSIAAGEYGVCVPTERHDEIGTLARSFNHMSARIEEVEAARQRQTAAIVHDLARPLTGMRAAVEVLEIGSLDDKAEQSDLLAGIGEELARLERLLETLQRCDARSDDALGINSSTLDLAHALQISLAQFELIAAQREVTLASKISPNLPPVVADQDRLVQLVVNLLDNALKFTPPGGKVTLEANAEHDAIQVRVIDTGKGIASGEVPKVFQHFYRSDSAERVDAPGMGLGLAICHEIITAHGGNIWVESEIEKGTQVCFTLPRA